MSCLQHAVSRRAILTRQPARLCCCCACLGLQIVLSHGLWAGDAPAHARGADVSWGVGDTGLQTSWLSVDLLAAWCVEMLLHYMSQSVCVRASAHACRVVGTSCFVVRVKGAGGSSKPSCLNNPLACVNEHGRAGMLCKRGRRDGTILHACWLAVVAASSPLVPVLLGLTMCAEC